MSHWSERAACAGLPERLFFPHKGHSTANEARAVCARCPVRELCLRAALDEAPAHYDYGVRGGLTAAERMALRRGARA